MKKLLLAIPLLLSSCATAPPITVSYTGHAGGHEYTAAYSKQSGAVLAVHQK